MSLINTILARFNTLRWRLTLFYSLLLAILLLAIGFFIYFQLDHFLTDNLNSRIRDRATFLAEPRNLTGPGNGPRDIRGGDINTLQNLAEHAIRDGSSADYYILILDSTGKIVTPEHAVQNSASFMVALPSSENLQKAKASKSYFYTTSLLATNDNNQSSSKNGLVYLFPVRNNGQFDGSSQPMGYLVIAASFDDVDRVLDQLRFVLLIGLLGAFGAALLLGLPLARLGLAPLKRITSTAVRIEKGDLSQRVNLPPLRVVAPDDEVRQLAQAFNQMLDQIELSFQAQKQSEARTRQFAADASHELRTPLTVLGGYLDVLLMGAKNEPARAEKIIISMRREVDRLSRLVINLLILTRMDANGATSLRLDQLSAKALVTQAVEDMKMVAGTRQIVLNLSPAGAEARLAGDNDQLHRVLVNLLDNAIRYTEATGRIELSLEISGEPFSSGYLIIRVRDNGCGIAPDQLPHIFDRFYRADESRSHQTGNAGLGLAIVKSITEAHGGTVQVESTVGQGTCFSLTLPRVPTPLLEKVI
jgi:two-component system OmpR family sensor kinase